MSGSLNHIIDKDGTFNPAPIENLGDAHEALEECFVIIMRLADGDMSRISRICNRERFPDPFADGDRSDDPEMDDPACLPMRGPTCCGYGRKS